jgi:hypothetical protein
VTESRREDHNRAEFVSFPSIAGRLFLPMKAMPLCFGNEDHQNLSSPSFLLVPLIGCLGWGDMFGEKPFIAGDYFLMEGEQNSSG